MLEGALATGLPSASMNSGFLDKLIERIGRVRPEDVQGYLLRLADEKGFLETGRDLKIHEQFNKIWKQQREPYLLETSCPGIFAAGDVRAGAMNRVASAVGEGSMAISFVHKYLAEV